MEGSPTQLQILITKLINNEIVDEELVELNQLLNQVEVTETIETQLKDVWAETNKETSFPSAYLYQHIVAARELSSKPTPRLRNNRKLWYAAAIFMIAGIVAVLYNNSDKTFLLSTEPSVIANKKVADALPNNKVMLTLSDGSKVALDNMDIGELTDEKYAEITKKEGQLVYQAPNEINASNKEQLFNTIHTPVGENYRLVLSDGTKVWLNATSSLKFPVVFTGSHRTVELTGEGYFEVAPDKTKPFTVVANKMNVDVVGTQFNVSAYTNDHKVTTSLIEGLVDVRASGKSIRLVPGQQAFLNSQTSSLKTMPFEVADVLAWKNGYFVFRNESIEDIMKKVSRWYNIDVVYKGDIAKAKFGGKYLKSSPFTELLTSLELTGSVHFNVEGRRVTVMQ